MQDFFYNGIWRMDWGLGNPNKTAALIATLMITVWGLTFIRKWGFWVALALFTALGICLIHTFSRGGLLALVGGMIPLLWNIPRPWSWKRVVPIAISIWIMVAVSISIDAHQRYEQGIVKEDRSITNRLEIWKYAPQMMVAAPMGWGLGNSGLAYMRWYEPIGHAEEYRTLVNSHLTWLVEVSWPLRFLYVALWVGVLVLCWPNRKQDGVLAVPFGIWLAFLIAASFSSVAESSWLWVVPGGSLLFVLVYRVCLKCWPSSIAWSIPAASSTVLILLCLGLGYKGNEIQKLDDGIVIGDGEPQIWVVIDPKVMGKNYGRIVREYLKSQASLSQAIAFSEEAPAKIGPSVKTVVFSGSRNGKDKFHGFLSSTQKMILLNPSYFPQELGLSNGSLDTVEIVFGEFTQSPAVNSWEGYGTVRRIAGAGDFLADWPKIVLAPSFN